MPDPVNLNAPGEIAAAIECRARVASDLDDQVYGAIIEPERQQDPDRGSAAAHPDCGSADRDPRD